MRRKREGFALIEILIAVAILALVGVMVQSSFRVLMNSTEDARENIEISRSAESLLWFITNELNNAFIASGLDFVSSDEGGSDEIYFYSTTAYPGAGSKGLFNVSYRVRDGKLWKGVDDDYFKAGWDVEGFSMRYYDGEEWHDEWDSNDSNRLPSAVELSIEIGGRTFTKTAAVPVDRRIAPSGGRESVR